MSLWGQTLTFQFLAIIEATFLSVLNYGDIIYRFTSLLKHLDTLELVLLYSIQHGALYENSGLVCLSERRDKHWNLFFI